MKFYLKIPDEFQTNKHSDQTLIKVFKELSFVAELAQCVHFVLDNTKCVKLMKGIVKMSPSWAIPKMCLEIDMEDTSDLSVEELFSEHNKYDFDPFKEIMFKKKHPITTSLLKTGIFRTATHLCKWLFIEESTID